MLRWGMNSLIAFLLKFKICMSRRGWPTDATRFTPEAKSNFASNGIQ